MAVRLRRSSTLGFALEDDRVVARSFNTRVQAPLSGPALRLLAELETFRYPAEILDPAPPDVRSDLARALLELLDLGFIVVEGTPAEAEEQRLAREWRWGPHAAHYHFGIKETQYVAPTELLPYLLEHVDLEAQPPLFTPNPPGALRLPSPAANGLLEVIERRRSYRGYADQPVPLAALAECLYAGLAIVGFTSSGLPGEQPLPLTTTPSGGARNPFEAFVVARSVEGLEPGVYHYAGLDHTLALVRGGALPPLGSLLGGQDWFDGAGCLVFLVANLARCTWKYPHPTGMRVVLIEAGHIAQNVLLAAAAHDLAATPTCAISDQPVDELLGLDRIQQPAIHAIALGVRSPQPSAVDLLQIEPNRALEASLP